MVHPIQTDMFVNIPSYPLGKEVLLEETLNQTAKSMGWPNLKYTTIKYKQ